MNFKIADFSRPLGKSYGIAAILLLLMTGIGCHTARNQVTPVAEDKAPDTSVTLREGDSVRITFPSASRLDTTQLIRRDGRIVLPVLGEINAAGLTPGQLEKEILSKYGNQLVTKEVTVTLESSSYFVFVNGAVLRPGKISSNRPLTVL